VDAIERLLGNDYFAKQLGKSARAQIEEFFDVKGMVYSYDNKFNKILYK
jgi:hypothetical protein